MSQYNGTSNGDAPAAPSSKAAEIGWLFVPQYYTLMNQDPSRLHCFYTKQSTMVHAAENEELTPSFGQQEIHARVQALGFHDTKVYVSNVDSQSSADGGIVIQVLGEMSNSDGPWRKFAQTFFLAQQPNGYYVLNDIFRYLKDEVTAEEDTPADASAQPQPVPEAPAAPQTNGAPAEPAPAVAPPAPQAIGGGAPGAAPAAEPAPAVQAAEPVGAGTTPKTWANLAASGVSKWGPTASESRGASEGGKTPKTAAAAPAAAPARGAPAPSAQVFIKHVNERVSQDALRAALESHFGALKECQVNTNKGFAFAEFASADSARRAIAASAPPAQGGAGGVKVGDATVLVETRRAPAERGGHRGRGAHRGRGRGGATA